MANHLDLSSVNGLRGSFSPYFAEMNDSSASAGSILFLKNLWLLKLFIPVSE
jgi:hypothetical protein